MRSEHISRALMTATSRFAVCNMISKGVREMHISGKMMSDSINLVAAMSDPTQGQRCSNKDVHIGCDIGIASADSDGAP